MVTRAEWLEYREKGVVGDEVREDRVARSREVLVVILMTLMGVL